MNVVKVVRPRTLGDALLFEVDTNYCRETCVLLAGSGSARVVPQFSVLGAKAPSTAQTATFAAKAGGNTGNGVVSAVSANAGAPEGDYDIVFIEPVANLGTFEVLKPGGALDGVGTVGTPYVGSINISFADGSTDWASGDGGKVHVAAGQGAVKVVGINFAATDGSQNAYGISLYDAQAADGVDDVIQVDRRGPAIWRVEELIWPGGATADQIAHATNQLEKLGLLVRASG